MYFFKEFYVSTHHLYVVPMEAGRVHWILWNCNFKWWLLGTKDRSYARERNGPNC